MQDSEPTTWCQIKKLMDMAMMVTDSLGIAGNPTGTLLSALVVITVQVGIVQGNVYWTIHVQSTNDASYYLVETSCIYLYQ
jgi:hypothetical protein